MEIGFIARKSDIDAFLTLCRCDMDIVGTGIITVERHDVTGKQEVDNRSAGTSTLILFYYLVPSSQDDKIMAAESVSFSEASSVIQKC